MKASECRGCGYFAEGGCDYWGCDIAEVQSCDEHTTNEGGAEKCAKGKRGTARKRSATNSENECGAGPPPDRG